MTNPRHEKPAAPTPSPAAVWAEHEPAVMRVLTAVLTIPQRVALTRYLEECRRAMGVEPWDVDLPCDKCGSDATTRRAICVACDTPDARHLTHAEVADLKADLKDQCRVSGTLQTQLDRVVHEFGKLVPYWREARDLREAQGKHDYARALAAAADAVEHILNEKVDVEPARVEVDWDGLASAIMRTARSYEMDAAAALGAVIAGAIREYHRQTRGGDK